MKVQKGEVHTTKFMYINYLYLYCSRRGLVGSVLTY